MAARALRILLLLLLPAVLAVSFGAFMVALVHGFHGLGPSHPGRSLFWLCLVLLPAWMLLGLRVGFESWPRLLAVHTVTLLILGMLVVNVLL